MRIISGKYKGRIITPPRNLRARPTTDFAKENLFNVLAGMVDFEECDVLDLFAGTGSVSYEFASRGARSVTAVEINAVHYGFIRSVAAELKLEKFFPVKANVFNYLRACTRRFDIIFSDAPYDLPGSEEVISLVFERGLLRPSGVSLSEATSPETSTTTTTTTAPAELSAAVQPAELFSSSNVARTIADFAVVSASSPSSSNTNTATAPTEPDPIGGLLIFEHSKGVDFSTHPHFLQTRSYGSVQFTFFG